jgi:superfamily II DNA or RNA helicase
VNKDDIVEQWKKAVVDVLGIPESKISVWRANSLPDPDSPVVIALIQSVMQGPERYPEHCFRGFGLLICDEVHRLGADVFSQCMWNFPAQRRLGLSATPYRKDGKMQVVQWHIGDVEVSATIETMIPKVLIYKTTWKVPTRVTLSGKVTQVYHQVGMITPILKSMCLDDSRNLAIARFCEDGLAKGRNLIVFSDQIEHLQLIALKLRSRGVPELDIGWYVGTPSSVYTSKGAAQKIERDKHKSRPIILATYKMASEATDIPWLDMCVLATPKADVVQIVGRIRREYPDKKQPVVVDFVDQDSHVLRKYSSARQKWYMSLGAPVKFLN